jgi:segregation and condensation protein B
MMTEKKKLIEAALFMSPEPMAFADLVKVCGKNIGETRAAINALIADYRERETALHVVETSQGFQLKVRPDYLQQVSHLAASAEFNKSVLKTLAIVAYKQPIKQADLIKYRTNKAYDDIKLLVEEGFVSRERAGRTFILRTTKKFLNYFGEDAVQLKPL